MLRVCDFMCSVVCCFSVVAWIARAQCLYSTECLLVVRLWRRHEHLWPWRQTGGICILLLDIGILAHHFFSWWWEMASQLALLIGESLCWAHARPDATASIWCHFNAVTRAFDILLALASNLVVVRTIFLVAWGAHAVPDLNLVAVKLVCTIAIVALHDCCSVISKVWTCFRPFYSSSAVNWRQL